MKIKYLPPSPNATVDFGYGEIGVNHVKNSDAGPLISAGFARHIPYRNYVERLAAEATSQTAGSFQNVSVDGVEWGFDGSLSQFRVPVIIKKEGSTTTIFCGPVAGTPAPISSNKIPVIRCHKSQNLSGSAAIVQKAAFRKIRSGVRVKR